MGRIDRRIRNVHDGGDTPLPAREESMDIGFLLPDSLLVAGAAATVLMALLLVGLWTAGSWLPRLLGGLDRFLTRIGFGSYTAKFLTWMEARFGEKWGRKG